MGQARFEFKFFPVSDKQTGSLANMEVQMWVDNTCIVKTTGWQIKEGRNGPFAAGPQYKSSRIDSVTGKPIYGNYVKFFPKIYNEKQEVISTTSDQYEAFQNQCVAAYHQWFQSGAGSQTKQYAANQNKQQTQNDGASLAPRIPVQSAPSGPVLPQGWTSNQDRVTNRRYFTDPQGNVYLEGDPRIATLISGAKPVATAQQNDPFASFGAVPGR